MRILVTGGTGFVGSNIIRELLNYNDVAIISTTRNRAKAEKMDFYDRVRFIQFDISKIGKDPFIRNDDLFRILGEPDAVIHAAWDNLNNYYSHKHIESDFQKSFILLKSLMESGVKNVTGIGTCLEYGKVNGRLDELMPADPIVPYAIAKNALRQSLEFVAKENGVSFKWLRLFYLFGDGQSRNTIFSKFEEAINNEEEHFPVIPEDHLRDYLHIFKVANNIAGCALQTHTTGVINICSGKPISIRKKIEEYIKEMKYHINLSYYDKPDYEATSFWGDNSKLMSMIK